MKFYFKLQIDGAVSDDPDGSNLPNLDVAREEALAAARELAAAAVATGREDGPDHILIADANGHVLATVALAEMIPKRLRK